jgi:ribonuclease VapC
MKSIVLDAYALLVFYQDERGSDTVEGVIRSAEAGKLDVFVSEINLGEVHYKTIRRIGLEGAKELLAQFHQLPVEVIPPSSEIILYASEVKAEHAISYADCFAVASAMKVEGKVLTGDPEFRKVEHLVGIEWI